MKYSELLNHMMTSILQSNDTSAHSFLREKENFAATAQLAVYTQGYRLRLLDALESVYPALLQYLGKPEFVKLGSDFIAAQPSREFNLDKYPIGFASYVVQQSEDSFARNLATLESVIHDVYQREESAAIDVAWAQRQTPETLASTVLLPRIASELLAFDYPVDGYFAAFRDAQSVSKPAAKKNWLMVLRHKHQVQRVPLQEAEFRLLLLFAQGLTLAQALEDKRMAVYTEEEQFPVLLQQWFGRWIGHGLLRQPL